MNSLLGAGWLFAKRLTIIQAIKASKEEDKQQGLRRPSEFNCSPLRNRMGRELAQQPL
jgi:hypothetical protein